MTLGGTEPHHSSWQCKVSHRCCCHGPLAPLAMGDSGTSTVLTRYDSMRLRSFCSSSKFGFTTLLTSRVISVAFYSEREKSDKFCSEALISASGSFTWRKSTTRDPRLCFLSEESHTENFYALKKSIDPGRVWTREPQIQWHDLFVKAKEPLRGQTFRRLTYVTANSPTFPSLYLPHSSFSNHSVASPTS